MYTHTLLTVLYFSISLTLINWNYRLSQKAFSNWATWCNYLITTKDIVHPLHFRFMLCTCQTHTFPRSTIDVDWMIVNTDCTCSIIKISVNSHHKYYAWHNNIEKLFYTKKANNCLTPKTRTKSKSREGQTE